MQNCFPIQVPLPSDVGSCDPLRITLLLTQKISMTIAMTRFFWQSTTLIAFLVSAPICSAEQLEAFTEPYKRVAIPAPEIGVITEIAVQEGDAVTQKQVLAKLDDEVLQASLLVSRAAKEALGARQSAEKELEIAEKQLAIYRDLQEQGNASQRELDRAETDQLQSASRLQSVREELEVRRLEYERVKAQIKQRVITSPIDGVVIAIDKAVGEFVSPTDPVVMHVVQLSNLKAVFSVPFPMTKTLRAGQTVKLTVGYEELECEGEIEFVSPVANAESATAPVKIRIPNPEHTLPSGVVCRWKMEAEAPVTKTAKQGSHYSR
jgi:RND family efflux transporter MFP subunit